MFGTYVCPHVNICTTGVKLKNVLVYIGTMGCVVESFKVIA